MNIVARIKHRQMFWNMAGTLNPTEASWNYYASLYLVTDNAFISELSGSNLSRIISYYFLHILQRISE